MRATPLVSMSLPLLALTMGLPAPAQPVERSAPTALPIVRTVPVARDVAWPRETIRLEVDATDTQRRVIAVRETIPVGAGPLTLLFPEWLPGNHSPRGAIDKIAGISFATADGRTIAWERDPLSVYAFHLSVPEGTQAIVASFQFLAPTSGDQGRIVMTDSLLNLQWNSVSLYPAGYYTRRIPIQASVTLPDGWSTAGAVRGTQSGNVVTFEQTDYETLVDSPIYAGRHRRVIALSPQVDLQVFADDPAELAATPEQVGKLRALVSQAVALFGAQHYDHYDFLLSISDTLGGIGLEHHRESENGVRPGYFTKWDALISRDLLAHEYTHSWNGKFRRSDILWTPDFATPMQDELLWVYEGQTQLWGYVLSTRSGMLSKAEALDALAAIAARLDLAKGRTWRPLDDTTNDPVISQRRPKAWPSWQRSEDYYNEGLMIWLEASAIIARESGGTKNLDDFARAFFGMNDGDWGVLTYNRQDVIDTLNQVQPYDWAGFLRARVDEPTQDVTKAGFTLGGYRLTYGDTPNVMIKAGEANGKNIDQSFGAGLVVAQDGNVQNVIWDSPAFRAGLTNGAKIVAVNETEFSTDLLRGAIAATRDGRHPLSLLVRQDKRYRTITLDYSGGIRYPRLEKIGEDESSLDRLLAPRASDKPAG